MSSHPINQALRFLLELAVGIALAYWGWTRGVGFLRYVLAFDLPLTAAVLWGTFAVPGDPSRSGRAPVPVPGAIRLLLELAIFSWGVWGLYTAANWVLSLGLGIIVIVHYASSYDRIAWLLRR